MRQAGAKAVFGRARSAWPETARRLASWSWKLRIAFGALCEEDICGGPSPKPTNFLRHGHEASRRAVFGQALQRSEPCPIEFSGTRPTLQRSGPPLLEFSEIRVGPSSLEFSETRPGLERSEPLPSNYLGHGQHCSGLNPVPSNFVKHGSALQRSEPCPIEFSGTRPTLQRSGPCPIDFFLRYGHEASRRKDGFRAGAIFSNSRTTNVASLLL